MNQGRIHNVSLMVATPIMGLVLGLIKLNTYVIGANQITHL